MSCPPAVHLGLNLIQTTETTEFHNQISLFTGTNESGHTQDLLRSARLACF